jgi:hypothetical protein
MADDSYLAKWRKPQKTEEAERGIGKFAIFYGVTQKEQ